MTIREVVEKWAKNDKAIIDKGGLSELLMIDIEPLIHTLEEEHNKEINTPFEKIEKIIDKDNEWVCWNTGDECDIINIDACKEELIRLIREELKPRGEEK